MATLAQEIKKRDPFESPEHEALLNLVRTAARLSAAYEPLFRRVGLCGAHYNILRILAAEKTQGAAGLPALEVRDRLITPVPDITRLVDKLARMKLVRRERTERDRRVVLLKITEKGQRFVDRLQTRVREIRSRQLGHLTRAELADLTRLLEKARAAR